MNVWLNEKLLSEAKTDTQKNTQNPIFNKIVFFDLNELDKESLLNSIKVELIVMDQDWDKDYLIGRLVLGGQNCSHWSKMFTYPLAESEVWHPIYDTLFVANESHDDEKEQPNTDSRNTENMDVEENKENKVLPVIEADKEEHAEAKEEEKPPAVDKVSSQLLIW